MAGIPKTDILLTHAPPFGICDMTTREESVGCHDLRARLPELRPRLHVFGHIHDARGAHIHSWGSGSELEPLPMLESNYDSDDSDAESSDIEAVATDPAFGTLSGTEGGDQTVFVNPAAWPAGRTSWRDGQKVPFGGPGVQPIIVDLLD
ncbi:hypothetical protein H0H92_006277 [Tricholoma furcatifolium]|nr:hypothetical protein H0H92_006277 [Tricholoma furcatifolium]